MEVLVAAVPVIVVAAVAYVLLRTAAARRKGEDTRTAGRAALAEALPVAGAALVGILVTFAAALVALLVLVLSVLGGDRDGRGFDEPAVWVFGAGALLGISLPVIAVVLVVRRRRRGGAG